jgi:flagellar hook protein FlgE
MGYFDTGLSGLNAAAADLNVIGNNVSNSGTTGFKESKMDFMNMISNTMNTSNSGTNPKVGSGVNDSLAVQNFAQGAITSTTKPMDLAINGNGFFQMYDPTTSAITYTRDGQFQLNASGIISNPLGQQLMGYPAAAGVVATGVPQPLTISSTNVAATATSAMGFTMNLASTSTAPTKTFPTYVTAGGVATNQIDPASYTYTTSQTAYNQQGAPQTVQLYFVAGGSGTNQWTVYSTTTPTATSSTSTTTLTPTTLGTMTFGASGALTKTSGPLANAAGTGFAGVPTDATGDTTGIDFSNATQMNSSSYVNTATQNGYAAGTLTGFSVGNDGLIKGTYSNGQAGVALGQVSLAKFTNPNGLKAAGNASWSATADSGAATVGVPGSGTNGTLQSSSLESSNVDQATQMVALLAAQRNYQANAQTIQVENTIAQTTISMGQ